MRFLVTKTTFFLLKRFHWRWHTGQQILAHQLHYLRKIRKFAYQHSPFYQRHHQGLYDQPLENLPVLTKAQLMENFDDLVTDRNIHLEEIDQFILTHSGSNVFKKRYLVCPTTGSSARQGIFIWNQREWIKTLSGYIALLSMIAPNLIFKRAKHAFIGSNIPFHLSVSIYQSLKKGWQPTVPLLVTDSLEKITGELNSNQPEAIHCYGSFASTLADLQLSGELKISPKIFITNSDKLTHPVREKIKEAWGIQPFDTYLSTEGGVMAIECSQHKGLHWASYGGIFEVVDEKYRPLPPGQLGYKILYTNLYKYTQPLIRYEIGDRIKLSTTACSCCYHAHPMIEEISGRTYEKVRLPRNRNGTIDLHLVFFVDVMDLFPITAWQVIQEADGSLKILVGVGKRPVDTELIKQRIIEKLKEREIFVPPITMTRVTTIPTGPGGKVKLIISKIAAENPNK